MRNQARAVHDGLEGNERAGGSSRSRVISTSVYGLLSYVIYLPLALVVSRIVVRGIGPVNFGIWSTLTTFTGFGFLLDFGISVPVVKYVSEFLATGRRREVNELLGTALVCYMAISLAFVLGMLLCRGWILSHVLRSHASDPNLQAVYTVLLLGFACLLSAAVLRGLLFGLQRGDTVARIALASNVVAAIGNIVAVRTGLSVPGLALSWSLMVLVNVSATWAACKWLFPELRLSPLRFRPRALRLILGFSVKVQVNFALETLNDQVDRGLIGYALGPTLVGFYSLAQQPGRAVRGISAALTASVLPAASELATLHHLERLRTLYMRGTKYIALAVLPLCGLGIVLAGPLVTLWLGRGYDRTAATLAIMLAGYCIWLPAQTATSALNGMNRADLVLRADLALLMLHLPICMLLIWRTGYFGTVAGTSAALAGTRIYIYLSAGRVLGVPVAVLLRRSLLRPLLATAAGLAPVLTLRLIVPVGGISDVSAAVCLFGVTYGLCVGLFALDDYDRDLIAQCGTRARTIIRGAIESHRRFSVRGVGR